MRVDNRRTPALARFRTVARRHRLSWVVRRAAVAALVMALLSLAALPALPAQARSPLTISPAGQVRAIAAGSLATSPSISPAPHSILLRTADPAAYAALKAAAAHRAPLGRGATSPQVPHTAVVSGLDQPGVSAVQNAARNQLTPPDTTGSIGANHYVEFVNSKVAVYTRASLALVATADLDTFVGATNTQTFDPQIQYDPRSQRWFYLADVITGGGSDYLAFGFSMTTDPSNLTTGWCRNLVGTDSINGGAAGAFFADFPKLGHDDTHVVFGDNGFTPSSFSTAQIWTYPKPAAGSLSTCPSISLTFFGSPSSPLTTSLGNTAFAPIPTNTVDSSAGSFVIARDYPNHIMTWAVGGTASTPTVTKNGDILVTGFSLPANVPQPGSPFSLDSSDTRLTQAVAHVDSTFGEAVWTQHTIAGATGYYSVDRWYELLPGMCSAGTCPAGALRQQGNVAVPGQFVFNGAISPGMDGTDAVIQYNVGSSSLAAQVRTSSRNGADVLGTMSNETLLAQSASTDQDFSCNTRYKVCRWGDYAGATPDPASTNRVWGSNQVNGPTGAAGAPHWRTFNFALAADEAPVAAFTVSPPTPTHGSPASFDGSTSSDADGSIVAWNWSFGDGGVGSGATPAHTYTAAGNYTAALRVTDSAGNTATTAKVIHVT